MDTVKLIGGIKTPTVYFDANQGLLEIKGKSIPEDTLKFYQPLYDWIDQYLDNAPAKTSVNIELEYFNTSSSICILQVLKKLETLHKSNKSDTLISWMYEEGDEDMMEAGENYQTLLEVPIKLVEVE